MTEAQQFRAQEPQTNEEKHFWAVRQLKIHAQAKHIWALGIVIVLGGQYFSWNEGLHAGIASYLIGVLLVGTAYCCFCVSLGEMASAIPFAGGSYGFARATLGKMPGYLVGCAETLEYIVYVAVCVLVFAEMITLLTGLSSWLEPLWWVLFYVVSLIIHIGGGELFWKFNFWFAVLITAIEVLFCIVTIPWMNFAKWAPMEGETGLDRWFTGGASGFFEGLPLITWLYIGIEALPLAAEETHEPKKNIAKGLRWGVGTLFVTAFAIVLATVALPPGTYGVHQELLVMNSGWAILFSAESQKNLMTLISLPAIYGTCFGFMFCYGRQVFAMSRSGHFPAFLSLTYKDRGTPYRALIAGSVAGLLIIIVGWFAADPLVSKVILFNVCLFGALLTYFAQLTCYIVLNIRFPSLHREYKSPFGIFGAIWALIVFIMCFVSALAFQTYVWQPLAILIGYYALALVYYFTSARHNSTLSPEEQFAMFMVYTIKFVRSKEQGLKKKRGQASTDGIRSANMVSAATSPSERRTKLSNNPTDRTSVRGKAWMSNTNTNTHEQESRVPQAASGYLSLPINSPVASPIPLHDFSPPPSPIGGQHPFALQAEDIGREASDDKSTTPKDQSSSENGKDADGAKDFLLPISPSFQSGLQSPVSLQRDIVFTHPHSP